MKVLKGGITEVQGISAVGKHIGLKKKRKDFGVIFCEKPATAVGIYTTNSIKAAPVILSKKHLSNGKAQAVVVNSSIANACTGKRGMKDAERTAELAAKELGIRKRDVIVASTGKIGDYLPVNKIKKGLKGVRAELSHSKKASSDFAYSILTTDRVKKEVAISLNGITIAGVAKGAGMISPKMATTLIFLATDAILSKAEAKTALEKAADKTFNMFSVDADMSTNDMAVLLANGSSGKRPDIEKFQKGLDFVCKNLVKKLAKDAEGATKFIEVNVVGAKKQLCAERMARAVVQSDLVKAAVFGSDPNWGRIMAAIGSTGFPVKENKVDIYIGGVKVVGKGIGRNFNKRKLQRVMGKREIYIKVNLNSGKANATTYGCDLTYGYIKINAEYHT